MDKSNENKNSERYCSVQESIIESLKQVTKMRNGTMPLKTWKELKNELQQMKTEEDDG